MYSNKGCRKHKNTTSPLSHWQRPFSTAYTQHYWQIAQYITVLMIDGPNEAGTLTPNMKDTWLLITSVQTY